MTLEICANSLASALAAQAGGAQRVELCTNLSQGGTTPSYGELALASEWLNIPVYVLIRPRPGNFVYNDTEYAIMVEDVRQAVALGCQGIVIGILLADGRVASSVGAGAEALQVQRRPPTSLDASRRRLTRPMAIPPIPFKT